MQRQVTVVNATGRQQNLSASNLTLIQNFDQFVSAKETFRQYRHRFGNYLKVKKVETDKVMSKHLLINSIGPEGYKVLCSVAAPDDPSTIDYDKLIEKVEKHLCPKVNIVVEQHRFFNCVQQEKQTIAQYVATLKQKILDCNFGIGCRCDCRCDVKVNDVLLRAQFIRGLQDTYTREQLLKVKNLTFQTTINEALVHEASQEDSKELSQNKTLITSTRIDEVKRISRKDQRESKIKQHQRSKSHNKRPHRSK